MERSFDVFFMISSIFTQIGSVRNTELYRPKFYSVGKHLVLPLHFTFGSFQACLRLFHWRKLIVLMASVGSLSLGLGMAVLSTLNLCVGPQLHWGGEEPHCSSDSLIDEWAAIKSLSDYMTHQPEPDRLACQKTCK